MVRTTREIHVHLPLMAPPATSRVEERLVKERVGHSAMINDVENMHFWLEKNRSIFLTRMRPTFVILFLTPMRPTFIHDKNFYKVL